MNPELVEETRRTSSATNLRAQRIAKKLEEEAADPSLDERKDDGE